MRATSYFNKDDKMDSTQQFTQVEIPEIIKYPDSILLETAQEVNNVDDKIRRYLQQMKAAMDRYNGIGLAAPQIGISLRLIIVRRDDWIYEFINPVISWTQGLASDYEGCLSLPGEIWQVERSREIVIEGINSTGKEQSVLARGLTARVFQHEVDHLNGILINSKGVLIPGEKSTSAV